MNRHEAVRGVVRERTAGFEGEDHHRNGSAAKHRHLLMATPRSELGILLPQGRGNAASVNEDL
ncbi:MAG: hypothetical protein H0T44_10480 [Gemmatimonadales bacterium]|nr:hypothetical protein [Gemmatimonadales bacterium]